MSFTKTQKAIIAFNVLYIAVFSLYYLSNFNYEFVAYIGLAIVFFSVIFATLKYTKFPNYILIGLSIWGLLHMMGGSIPTADGVLYAWRMIPIFDGGGEFYILKYDQVVHGYFYGVMALVFLHLLRNYFGLKHSAFLVGFIAILASAGFSTINEIVEFSAVVALPETGVGGYYNTMLDIVFNFAGALIGVVGYNLISKN